MSKPLLNADSKTEQMLCRTSKSDEVCRYLLFSFANKIGPDTLKLVQVLCPQNITDAESLLLDDIITSGVFSDSEIETAASITIQDTGNLFANFLDILFWEL
jgi:hypothetical protein